MPLIVFSPHSGKPVKIRDADVGRAVRDEAGRIFYVVPRPEGRAGGAGGAGGDGGHYAALTRHGSDKDLERYEKIERGEATLASATTEPAPAAAAPAHDARGVGRRPGLIGRIVALILLLAVLLGAYLTYTALQGRGLIPGPALPALPFFQNTPAPPAPDLTPLGWSVIPVQAPAPAPAPNPAPAPVAAPAPGLTAPAASALDRDAEEARAAALDRDAIEGFTATSSGLRLRTDIPAPADAPRARPGDFIVVRYVQRDERTGLILDETPPGEPLGYVLWSGTIGRGLEEGIAGMRVGEQRTLVIPGRLVDRDATRTPGGLAPAPGAGDVRAEIELLRVLPGVDTTAVRSPAAGTRRARPGDTLRLHWDLHLADPPVTSGNAPDATGPPAPIVSTRRFGGPARVTLGRGEVIRGLELGLLGLRVGAVADVRIPSYLAYGALGTAGGLIPPGADLRCRVEVLAIEAG